MRSTEAATEARRSRGEESRERLIEAASALIADSGYGATSIGDICRRAGVAKTALYWHFESKEGLLAAVLESVGGRWIEELRKRAYLESDPIRRMNGLIEDWRRLVTEQPRLVRLPLFLQLEVGEESSPAVRAALQKVFDQAEQALAVGIEDSIGKGRVFEVEEIAHTALSLLQVAASRSAIAQSDAEVDRIFDEVRRTILLVVWSRVPGDVQQELMAAALGGSGD
jgi:AcrR family transcriptional regulator